jgi:hypothetical protein
MYSLPTTGRKTVRALESTLKVSLLVAGRPFRGNSKRGHKPLHTVTSFLVLTFLCVVCATFANAEVTSISIQSPGLSPSSTTNVTSPVHVAATAEDLNAITGYVVYVDGVNVYRNFSSTVDAWIPLPSGSHKLLVKAWDAHSDLATATYQINVTGFAAPTPPVGAQRTSGIDGDTWTVDNNPDVGGKCNNGSLGSFANSSDPNTENAPGSGQHFVMNGTCQYDDSLFYWKSTDPQALESATNYLWEFWFYIPNTTQSNTVQAMEFDLFQTVPMSDGMHEFMFGSQCDYAKNAWDFWLPSGSRLTWVTSNLSPCRFSTGAWHHAVYFLQRVTSAGYQEIPQTFSPSTDMNSYLRFGTLTIDGQTMYLGGLSWSTIPKPAWGAVAGVQHQLDTSVAGALIEQYSNRESLTTW